MKHSICSKKRDHMDNSICWYKSTIWSTPYGNINWQYGVLHMAIMEWKICPHLNKFCVFKYNSSEVKQLTRYWLNLVFLFKKGKKWHPWMSSSFHVFGSYKLLYYSRQGMQIEYQVCMLVFYKLSFCRYLLTKSND